MIKYLVILRNELELSLIHLVISLNWNKCYHRLPYVKDHDVSTAAEIVTLECPIITHRPVCGNPVT